MTEDRNELKTISRGKLKGSDLPSIDFHQEKFKEYL